MDQNVQSSEPRAAPVGENPRASPDIAALTRRMTGGDEMAWRTFYDAYFDRLWRYLLVVAAGNEDAAREALQATLLRVARHVKVFRDESVFWSWLTVLARSAFADETRKRRRYFAFLERFTQLAEAEHTFGADGAADEQLRELLGRNLTALPRDESELIAQKYFLRRSVREIAGAQQTTEKAVESKLSRVRRKLKESILAGLKNEQ